MSDPTRIDALSRRTILKGLAGAAGLVSIPAIMAACSTPAASTGASAPPAATSAASAPAASAGASTAVGSLSVGSYKPIISSSTSADLLAYVREDADRRFLAVLNLGPRPAHLPLEGVGQGEIVVATEIARERQRVSGRIVMRGDDAVLVRLD